MRLKIQGTLLAVSCVSVGIAAPSYADEKAHDFYFQQQQQRFVQLPQNARMFGMAGSTNLTEAGALSTAQNPAGLGMMKYGDVSAAYGYNEISGNKFPGGTSTKDKQNSGQIFGATPINPVKDGLPDGGNIGLGWHGRYGDWTNDADDTESSTYQVSGAYGKAISEDTSIGYGLTYQNDEVNANSYDYTGTNNFLHNVGLQYRESSDLTLGTSLQIGHGSHKLERVGDQTTDQMSVGVGGGAEYSVSDTTTLAGGVDYTYYDNSGDTDTVGQLPWGGDSTGHAMNIRVGVEEQVIDWLALRAGYRYASNFNWDYKRASLDDLDGSAKYNAWTAGAGVRYLMDEDSFIQAVNLDYGVEYRDVGNNDWQHLVSLSTPFDLCM